MKNISTLYIDESGMASLTEKAEEPFILTGVILAESEQSAVEGFLNYIKRKYGINPAIPFHSYDIFENPQTRSLSDSGAAALVETLADFISLIPIAIRVVAVHKKEFKQALGITSDNDFKGSKEKKELRDFPYRICACKLFEWFAKDLQQKNAIGEIVVDARRGGDYQLIKTLYASKQHPHGYLDEKSARLITEKCNAICFAEKRYLSGGLELTDFISYVTFFHARRKMSTMQQVKLQVVWEEIRKKLYKRRLHILAEQEIQKFFKIKKGEVHKYLNEH